MNEVWKRSMYAAQELISEVRSKSYLADQG
jgi:hypothetical protein